LPGSETLTQARKTLQLAFPFFLAVIVGGLAGFYESENSKFDDYHWLALNWMFGMLGENKKCCV